MSKAKISSLSGATRKAGRSVFLSLPRSSSNLAWMSFLRLVRRRRSPPRRRRIKSRSCSSAGDPVALGLVKSFARPGGNVTGLTFITVELAPKRIQLLKEAVSVAKRVAILWNPNNVVNKLELSEATASAETLGLTLLPVEIRTPDDIEGAFNTMARERADATLILSNSLTFPNRSRMANLR